MAKNEVYRIGQYVPAPVPAPAAGSTALADVGRPLHIGDLNVVQVSPRNSVEHEFGGHAGEAAVDLGGAHKFPVDIVTNPLSWGQRIFITDAGVLTTVVGTNTLFGHALEYNVPTGNGTLVVVKIKN